MSKKLLSRREFLRASMVAAGGAALAGSLPQAFAAPPAQDGVAIQYWVFWNQYGDPAEQFGPALNDFVAPNTVEITTGVGISDAFLTAVAAGTPPDVGTGARYADYMANGQVNEITDYVAASDAVKEENFAGAAWDTTIWQGVQYGVSAIEAFVRRGLNYNSNLVEEAGLDPDNPPQTWEDLMVWHQALTKFDDAGNVLQIGLDPYDAIGGQFANSQDGSFAAESFGVHWWDPENRVINFDGMAESYDTMGEFVKVVGPDNLSGFHSAEGQGTWGGSYSTGVQAMIIEGYWHPGETTNENPDIAQYNRATWVPVPASRAGTKIQVAGGHMVFFWKDAVVPADVAWPVAEFLLTPEHNDSVFNSIGWLPAFLPYLATADPNKYPGLKFYFDSLDTANEWEPLVKMEIMPFIEQKNLELRERVFRGELTGAEAAQELQDAAVQEYQDAGFA
jgi:maltose-binding protein MalE